MFLFVSFPVLVLVQFYLVIFFAFLHWSLEGFGQIKSFWSQLNEKDFRCGSSAPLKGLSERLH